jgi:PAS domain S-box-containing protein
VKIDWVWDKLDPIETRVAELLVEGKSNTAICAEVYLSRARIQDCIKRIVIKAGVDSTRAAIALLVEERENQSLLGILEEAKAGIVVVQDRVVKFANRSAREIWGYDLDEIAGRPLIELIAASSRNAVASGYELRMKGEQLSQSYAIRVLCKGKQEEEVFVTSAGSIQFRGKPAVLAIVNARP